jgi:superfamily II RNA helicase
MASEIAEGHSFLMTEVFCRLTEAQCKDKNISLTDLLTILSLFLGEAKQTDDSDRNPPILQLDVPACVKEEFQQILSDAVMYEKKEKELGAADVYSHDFWQVSGEWVEPLQDWILAVEDQETAGASLSLIAQKYEQFEGNVLKAILKLASLLEEWQALATLAGQTDMLRLCEEGRALILRDIVVAESLYLRL